MLNGTLHWIYHSLAQEILSKQVSTLFQDGFKIFRIFLAQNTSHFTLPALTSLAIPQESCIKIHW